MQKKLLNWGFSLSTDKRYKNYLFYLINKTSHNDITQSKRS
ncbi:hypothetical protein GNVKYODX_CDS38 [Acinetobacter phage vB_AbaM_AB3P2]|nr:hypothetical protein GNVKYODX_CDS38 [Acinetobacter phage vB_AbaM_AB3P2]